MLKMVRSIISSVTEGTDRVIKRFSGTGRTDETFTNREYFQHYGFTSRPLNGAEGILIKEGNNIILIASDDRRYRLQIEDGEVALYSDEGDSIHLKRNKEIHITTGGKLIVDATNEVTINTADANVNCSGKAIVTAEGGVDIDGGSGNLKGVVQGDCICHFTGSPHGNVSGTVKSSL